MQLSHVYGTLACFFEEACMKKIPILFAMITILFLGCSSKNGSKNETSKPEPLKITDRVIMETTEGSITLGLYCNAMPVTCNNFKRYISEGFYKGLVFHRVIDGFMIQGVDSQPTFSRKKAMNQSVWRPLPTYPIRHSPCRWRERWIRTAPHLNFS